jgi:hypothetical protein
MRYIRHGSFGCVVEPALPNEDETGWVEFPTQVSKLFRNKRNYMTALNRTRKAQSLMGYNSGHQLNTYQHDYKTADAIPNTIRRQCTFEEGEPMYVTRMPHLGVSFWDVDTYSTELRQIPIQTILQQIYKLLTQVQSLHVAEYIHGDIRQTNVMIHPKTGVMTLIDFDWLLPADEYLQSYPLGFYSNPPECLLAKELRTEIDGTTNIPTQMDQYMRKLLEIPERREMSLRFAHQYSRLLLSDVFGVKTLMDWRPYLQDNLQEYQKRNKDLISPSAADANQSFFSTYDSYGLGFTLYDLLEVLYPGGTENEMATNLSTRITMQGRPYTDEGYSRIAAILFRLKVITMYMGHVLLRKRLTIDEAIERFLAIPGIKAFGPFQECGGSCSLMGGHRTRKSRRNSKRV